MEKVNIGTNEDGSPRYHFSGEHVVYTGPITGTVEVNGKQVDVSADFVEASSPEHAAAIAHAVATAYVEQGHPTDPGFTYEEGK